MFKDVRATEQKDTRAKSKQKDEVTFKVVRAAQQRTLRNRKRQENEKMFKDVRATEQKETRAKSRQKDEVTFKMTRTAQQNKLRNKKRQKYIGKYKENKKTEYSKWRISRTNTEKKRMKLFREATKFGRIFPCICCHRLLFRNGVIDFIAKDFDNDILMKSIGKFYTEKQLYICFTCKKYLLKKKTPPMCHRNNLQLLDIRKYKELNLTELENSMIALNVIFQKVFKLPKSRWPAMKDKTVNIPIFEKDIIHTLETLKHFQGHQIQPESYL